jgi:hypothetical protein
VIVRETGRESMDVTFVAQLARDSRLCLDSYHIDEPRDGGEVKTFRSGKMNLKKR